MVKIPAVPKPSKTYVAGQREKNQKATPPSRPVRVVEAEEVENVRAELVKVPENCLEMQPVVTAAAAPLADGLGPVVKEAFGPGAKVKQMRLKSGVRTEEAKKSEDNIMKLIELITQGGSFDYTFEEDLSIPIDGNEQIDNIVVEAGTSIAIAVESTPIKQKVPILGTVTVGYQFVITCPLVAKLSLDFADGAEIQVPFSSLGCCTDWCASCKEKPPSACCESGGCCVKGGECACWTEPYLVLRPRTLELDVPLTLSLNDSIMISDIPAIISDPSKLLKTLVIAVTERPYIKAKAALRCCRDWVCFPFMQLFSLCANTCLLPCVLRGLSKRLVGMTFGPGADKEARKRARPEATR
ncbi:hypothetical protein EMIHUDRAFT_433714 [Emiliania huxleyi CCMP1516]|uniref:Uncharacterized protein n=2 Tax=Emiliania huxleyi TaxID=2903 RepID=A0A0D3KM55_EMIH1|nr:hypothetical protein EMIHUDRAFT_433714 [Emiliania huxleyi CCMP1516]EOD36840.1 hypothetical protein EMIHUDRAFT_433714 [Emiliania huxleyi CCMP1516]|eukprot:XP_005789269.1 hypothetical protein EMIHUDRAFT_433714 [Emiliania huxleyi CCMP1516]